MAKLALRGKPGNQENALTPNDRDHQSSPWEPNLGTQVPSPVAPTRFFHLPCFPRGCEETRKPKTAKALLNRQPNAQINSSPQYRKRGRFPRRKRVKDRERVWPQAVIPLVPTIESGNLGGKTLGQVPSPLDDPLPQAFPQTVKRVHCPDPQPPPPAAWQPRREPGGPAPSQGTPGARPTPDARRGVSSGGYRDKKQG